MNTENNKKEYYDQYKKCDNLKYKNHPKCFCSENCPIQVRSTFEMEKIINRTKALERKEQIRKVKYDIQHSNYYNTAGSLVPIKDKIQYAIDNGKRFLKSKIKYI